MRHHNIAERKIDCSETAELFLASTRAAAPDRAIDFLYLNQQAVLDAGVLDMTRAMRVVERVMAAFEEGRVRQPSKVVLRKGNDTQSEVNGRINGLCAFVNHESPSMGMKWVASFPANRERGLPRASALI